MNIVLQITNRIQELVEIKIMRLHSCRLQYNQINQMCSHNQNSIEICSAQQVEADKELLYTESWHFEMHVSWHACWACMSHYTKSATLCWSHITMCWLQYHDVSCESHLLDLEQSASVFCYNYSSLKKNICISTVTSQKSSESYFMSIILNIQQLLLNQIISSFSV